jgi:hypothetical protein
MYPTMTGLMAPLGPIPNIKKKIKGNRIHTTVCFLGFNQHTCNYYVSKGA